MSPKALPSNFILPLLQATSLFSGIAAGAASDLFTVKTGSGGGSCDGYPVDQWFTDSQTLIASASKGVAATDTDSRQYLKTFFSIGPNDDAGAASSKISAVNGAVNGGSVPGGKPWLFCGSDWVVEQKWTDVAYDETTGNPRADKKSVETVKGPTNAEKAALAPFWSSDLKQYVYDESGDYCSRNNGENLAGTQDITQPSTVTLCVKNFNSAQGQFLSNIPAVSAVGTSVSTIQVQSLTLFHELFHLANGCAGTPDAKPNGYKLASIVRYGTGTATTNPESYTFYALSYWLGEQYTQYTFASSKSAAKKSTPRRWLDDWLKAYQPAKRWLEPNMWVA